MVNPLNPSDPLYKVGTEHDQTLFKKLVEDCRGHPRESIAQAAFWLIINCIRQDIDNIDKAEWAFNELAGRAKQLLLDEHYDRVTKRRRNIFPFNQVITPALFVDPETVRGKRSQ
jgi:hypothetical protein